MKRIYGGKSIQTMIQDLLNERPNLTVIQIVQTLGITIRDANIAINKLLKEDLITKVIKLDIED